MKKIEIYTKDYCPYCTKARDLLLSKGASFTEYDITRDSARELEMRERSGRKTVPEIFIDNELIGGCDDLHALEKEGNLDGKLGLA